MKTALVVDDKILIADSVAEAITQEVSDESLNVLTTDSQKKATQILKGKTPIDILVTDINLSNEGGDKEGGIILARLAKHINPSSGIFIYTSHTEEEVKNMIPKESYPWVNLINKKGKQLTEHPTFLNFLKENDITV